MKKIAVITDSCSGVKNDNIEVIPLYYRFNNENIEYGEDIILTSEEFFEKMRQGAAAKTSAVNKEIVLKKMEGKIKEGYDIIYVSISSELSGSYGIAYMASLELQEKYPNSKMTIIDSSTASLAEGMIVTKVLNLIKEEMPYEKIIEYINQNKKYYCAEFLVDDLKYLRNGGRISPTKALIGKLIGVRPILHASDEGKVEVAITERGSKAAMKSLANRVNERADSGVIHIIHADALESAEKLHNLITLDNQILISPIDLVIGAHVGPEAYGVCYTMKKEILKR